MRSKQDCVRARTPTDSQRQFGLRDFDDGMWKPDLNIRSASYTVQQGWYQKVGKVVTIGWKIEAQIPSSAVGIPIQITGVPYKPLSDAFGGGVARNISYNQENSAFEGWCVNTDGVIKTSCTSIYPLEGGKVILAGTICYAVS